MLLWDCENFFAWSCVIKTNWIRLMRIIQGWLQSYKKNSARLNESSNSIYWVAIMSELIAEEESEKIFSHFYTI